MKLNLTILLALALGFPLAGQPSELATGRAYYSEGEFKKAAAHLQLAVKFNPNDAESNFWLGMSYEVLGDIAAPLGHRYYSRARIFFTRAAELAPARTDYRNELFNFLLDAAGASRGARRQAAALLRTVAESDSDFSSMRERFERDRKANASASTRLGDVFLAVPRAAYRVGEISASAFSKPPERDLVGACRSPRP
jgi:tetratricopeptide (TPR) repeat protein